MVKQKYIVAEVTKTWRENSDDGIISQQFEKIINVNAIRGYELHSWKFTQTETLIDGRPVVVETIIAVFKRAAA